MKKIIIFLFINFSCNFLIAQYRPPGLRDMTLVKNISDVLQDAMPWLEDQGARVNSTNAIKGKNNIIAESLNWTVNSGYLIRVKVLRSTLTGATVPMPPEFLGVGPIPSDILAVSSSQPSMSSSPNPNLVLASDRSFFIWVTQKRGFFGLGSKKLVYGVISNPFSEQLTNDALTKMANVEVLRDIRIAQKGNALLGITQNLKRNVKDKEAALRLSNLIEEYRKNEDELNKADFKLKQDLKRMDQANQTLNFLNTMKNILSVASLGFQVSAAMSDIPQSEINKAKTPNDLIMSVETYKSQYKGRIEEYQRQIFILKNINDPNRSIIYNELYNLKVPSSVINNGFNNLP